MELELELEPRRAMVPEDFYPAVITTVYRSKTITGRLQFEAVGAEVMKVGVILIYKETKECETVVCA